MATTADVRRLIEVVRLHVPELAEAVEAGLAEGRVTSFADLPVNVQQERQREIAEVSRSLDKSSRPGPPRSTDLTRLEFSPDEQLDLVVGYVTSFIESMLGSRHALRDLIDSQRGPADSPLTLEVEFADPGPDVLEDAIPDQQVRPPRKHRLTQTELSALARARSKLRDLPHQTEGGDR